MKALFRTFIVCIMMTLPNTVTAQDENDIVNFLASGQRDASKLMNAYLNPAIEGLSYGFNGGCYTTAKAHKSFGFDIGVTVNAVFISKSRNYFSPNSLGLENITSVISTAPNGMAPTIMGPAHRTTYTVDSDGNGQSEGSFEGPNGVDFQENLKINGVLAPTAQIGIGIYKNTDLKIRFMPEVKTGSSKISLSDWSDA